MSASDRLVELYSRWQDELQRHGCTRTAADIFFDLCKLVEANPYLDTQGFTAVLEQLHLRAFPQASSRPPRLTAGEIADLRE